jgi:hypothetical protein
MTTSNRKIATIIGVLFLAGMAVGILGNILIQSVLGTSDYLSAISANSIKVAIGAILLLMTVAGDAAHGILIFPVLKRYSVRVAFGYFGFRMVDAIFLGIQVLLILTQIPLGSEYIKATGSDTFHLKELSTILVQSNLYAYHIGMLFLGMAGSILCYAFYKTKLVPKVVAIWGMVGYATMLVGSVLEVAGIDLHMIQTIPGGLWEIFIGVWLIAKGFNSSPVTLATVAA